MRRAGSRRRTRPTASRPDERPRASASQRGDRRPVGEEEEPQTSRPSRTAHHQFANQPRRAARPRSGSRARRRARPYASRRRIGEHESPRAGRSMPIGLPGRRETTSTPTTRRSDDGRREHADGRAFSLGRDAELTSRERRSSADPTATHRGGDERRRAARAHARTPSRSQSDTCAGCIVSSTTPRSSAVERLEFDLLAQPRAERVERALRVVAAPVEAPVDEPLHARAQRQEERGDDQRRHGDRQVRSRRRTTRTPPGRRGPGRRTPRRASRVTSA